MPMPGYCPTCKFFDLIPAQPRTLQSSSPVPTPKIYGRCRNLPPQRAYLTPNDPQTQTDTQWPICSDDDWCGQYIVGIVPANTVLPNVTGGTAHPATLTTDNGTWNTAIDSYTYQWQNNGIPISGATTNTYSTTGKDVGDSLDCMVTATNAIGSASATSNLLGPIT